MIREGYLLYLKKWVKLQEQTRTEVRADSDDNRIRKDLQPLAPGRTPKFGDSQELAKSDDTTHPLEDEN